MNNGTDSFAPPKGIPDSDNYRKAAAMFLGLVMAGFSAGESWGIVSDWLIWNGTGEGGNGFSLAQFFEEEE